MRVQIVLKGEEDPHWITPSHHPGSDYPVFDVQCSVVNVTRRGTIINVYSCILQILSHMSILNILLINFFITIWNTTKVFGLYQKATRKFMAQAWFKIGNGGCSGRGVKIYYFSYHYKTLGQSSSPGDQIGTCVTFPGMGLSRGIPLSLILVCTSGPPRSGMFRWSWCRVLYNWRERRTRPLEHGSPIAQFMQ